MFTARPTIEPPCSISSCFVCDVGCLANEFSPTPSAGREGERAWLRLNKDDAEGASDGVLMGSVWALLVAEFDRFVDAEREDDVTGMLGGVDA